MKKTLIIAGSLVTAVVGGLLLAPSLIDWDQHRDRFQSLVEQRTGCRLEIGENVRFTLLPAPQLTLQQPRLKDADGRPLVAARWARADLSLRALVQGRAVVEKLHLVEPGLTWRDGFECRIADSDTTTNTANEGSATPATEPETTLSIDLISIRQGRIHLADHPRFAGTEITGLDAEFRFDDSQQRLTGSGEAVFRQQNAAFELSLSGLGGQTRQGGVLNLSTPHSGLKLTLTGQRSALTKPVTGKLAVEAESLAALQSGGLLPTLSLSATGLAKPASLESDYSIENGHILLNNLEARIAGQTVNGAVSLPLAPGAPLEAALSVKHLDLDELVQTTASPPETPQIPDGQPEQPPNLEKDPEQRQAAPSADRLAEFLDDLLLPGGPQFSLDIAIDRLFYREALVQEAAFHVTRARNAIVIDRASALLPGGSSLSLNGSLDSRNNIPEFIGELSFRSNDFRRFLAWANLEADSLSGNRLRSAALQSQVIFSPGYLGFHALDAQVDSARINGFFERQAGTEEISLESRFLIDRLNLDAYGNGNTVPTLWGWLQSGFKGTGMETRSGSAGTTQSRVGGAKPSRPTYWKTDIEVANLTSNGLPMEEVALTLAHTRQGLMLERFQLGDLRGLSLQASGRLPSLGRNNNASLAVSYFLPEPEKTAARFGSSQHFRHLMRHLGAGSGSVLLEGELSNLATRFIYDGDRGWIKLDGDAQWGGDHLALTILDGGVRLPELSLETVSGTIRYQPDGETAWRDLKTRWKDFSLQSNGSITPSGSGLAMAGELSVTSDNLEKLDGLTGQFLKARGAVSAHMAFRSSDLSPEKPIASITGEGTLAGQLSLTPGTDLAADSAIAPVRRLRTFVMASLSDKDIPLTGKIRLQSGNLILEEIEMRGKAAVGVSSARLNTDSLRLSASLALFETGHQDPLFSLQANGPLERPNLKTAGRWLAGK